MHVVMVGNYPAQPNEIHGGVEAVTRYLSQALQAIDGIELDVITLLPPGQPDRTATHGRVRVHYLERSTLPSYLSIARDTQRMRDRIRTLQPDIIHAHVANEFALAARASGLPWLVTLHGMKFREAQLEQGLVNRWREWVVRCTELSVVRSAKHLIAISSYVRDVFSTLTSARLHDVSNPVAQPFFELNSQPVPGRLLYVGGLMARKDAATLLRAMPHLRQVAPHAHLHLGGGPLDDAPNSYYGELREIVERHNLADCVTFLGQISEESVLAEYAACEVFVLPSREEMAPMVILQAMAAGRPTVATDNGGSAAVVHEGETGLLTPIGDEEALAEALGRLLAQPALAAQMGCRARDVARQQCHANAVATRTAAIYQEILSS